MLVAFAGLAVAVLLSVAASNLSTQPIGISGDKLGAGRLAPPAVVSTATSPALTDRTKTTPRPRTRTQAEPGTNRAVPEAGDDRAGHHTDNDDD